MNPAATVTESLWESPRGFIPFATVSSLPTLPISSYLRRLQSCCWGLPAAIRSVSVMLIETPRLGTALEPRAHPCPPLLSAAITVPKPHGWCHARLGGQNQHRCQPAKPRGDDGRKVTVTDVRPAGRGRCWLRLCAATSILARHSTVETSLQACSCLVLAPQLRSKQTCKGVGAQIKGPNASG